MGGQRNTSIETASTSPKHLTAELLVMKKSSSNHRYRSTDHSKRQDHRPNLIHKRGQRQLQQPLQQNQIEQMTSDRSKPSLGKRRDSFNSSFSHVHLEHHRKESPERKTTNQPIPENASDESESCSWRLPQVSSGTHLAATLNSTDLSSSGRRSSIDNYFDVNCSGGNTNTAPNFADAMRSTGRELASNRQQVMLTSERRRDDSKELRFPPIPLSLSNHELRENEKVNDEYVRADDFSDDDVYSGTPRRIEITTITLIGNNRSATTGSVENFAGSVSGPGLATGNSFATLPSCSRTTAKKNGAAVVRKPAVALNSHKQSGRDNREDAIVIDDWNSPRPIELSRHSNVSRLHAIKFGSTRVTGRLGAAATVDNDGSVEYPPNSQCDSPTMRRIVEWLTEVDRTGPADRPPTADIFEDEPTQTDTAIHIVYDGD